jgi:hypothetical protein
VQITAAYALDVLLYLLNNKATMYLLSWAKPYGMTVLRRAVHDAFMHMERYHIQHDSFLGDALTKANDFMHSAPFKSIRAAVGPSLLLAVMSLLLFDACKVPPFHSHRDGLLL